MNGECGFCGGGIQPGRRADTRYCSVSCRLRASRVRRGLPIRTSQEERFWSKVSGRDNPDGCWTWVGLRDPQGYGRFSQGPRGSMTFAHRQSWSMEYGAIPDGLMVRHSCDNPPCVNPRHLALGTHLDNMRDMAERERAHATRLTASDVIEVRQRAADGEPLAKIAKRFGVTAENIRIIVQRKSWRHVS